MRLALVQHLRASRIEDEDVLRAVQETPRHLFVPPELIGDAYLDSPLAIGEGQTISQPWVVARMTEYIMETSPKKVLEIGTGSGYQAAVLSRLVDRVYTMERIERLALRAARAWKTLGIGNIFSTHGDGRMGWPRHAPFDAIMVTAAASEVPQELFAQLVKGGHLVMPLGESRQRLHITYTSDERDGRAVEDFREHVRFVGLQQGLRGMR